jgi:ribosome biogenesis GTPase
LEKHFNNNGTNTKEANARFFQAVVASITNKQCQVLAEGSLIPCLIPGSLLSDRNALAVGDRVEATAAGPEQYKLVRVLSRETALCRGDRRTPGETILVAANAGYLLAVATADYLLTQAGYFESAIIAAKRAGIGEGLFLSKWDLTGDAARTVLEDKLNLYRGCADAVFTGSAHEADDGLIRALRGKTVVVTGDRSCGKTSLIHAVMNRPYNRQGDDGKLPGTHTSVLHAGPEATLLIDTPGFRSFALSEVTEAERSAVFPEIARLEGECRFRSCTHTHEDGCRLLDALRAGEIRGERYDAYQGMAAPAAASAEERQRPAADYRHTACAESYVCKVCGTLVVPEGAGSQHRNHCPKCLSSVHVDNRPGDRASLCNGVMEPVSVWVRKGGEWAIIHRCRLCGTLSSNRIAGDDNPMLLMSIAVKPLAAPPFPLGQLAPPQ